MFALAALLGKGFADGGAHVGAGGGGGLGGRGGLVALGGGHLAGLDQEVVDADAKAPAELRDRVDARASGLPLLDL